MRAAYLIGGHRREGRIAAALMKGIEAEGDGFVAHPLNGDCEPDIPVRDCDVALMWGVTKARHFHAYKAVGYEAVLLDKAHVGRRNDFIRFSVASHQPTRYVMDIAAPPDRWEAHGIRLAERRRGRHVVLALSSQKYCDWHGYGDATVHATALLGKIRRATERPIVYRPKPSWRGARPLADGEASCPPVGGRLACLLADAHALVTHGSGACVDALIAGVPTCAVGGAVTTALRNTELGDIEDPDFPADADRLRFLCNLSYCQWTLAAIADGLAWRHVKPWIGTKLE